MGGAGTYMKPATSEVLWSPAGKRPGPSRPAPTGGGSCAERRDRTPIGGGNRQQSYNNIVVWVVRTNLWASRKPPMCLYKNTQRTLRRDRPKGSEAPKGHAHSNNKVCYVTTTQHRPRRDRGQARWKEGTRRQRAPKECACPAARRVHAARGRSTTARRKDGAREATPGPPPHAIRSMGDKGRMRPDACSGCMREWMHA